MAIIILLLVCAWMVWTIGAFKFAIHISDGDMWGFVVWVFLTFLPIAIAVQVMVS